GRGEWGCLERAVDRLGDPEVAKCASAALGLLFVERVRHRVRFLRRVLHAPYICCQGFRLHHWPAVPRGVTVPQARRRGLTSPPLRHDCHVTPESPLPRPGRT